MDQRSHAKAISGFLGSLRPSGGFLIFHTTSKTQWNKLIKIAGSLKPIVHSQVVTSASRLFIQRAFLCARFVLKLCKTDRIQQNQSNQ